MKPLIFFFLFTISFNGITQDRLFYSPQFYKAAQWTHQAEMAIVKQNYEQANCFYDSAFALMPEPSGHDVWNRAMLANELNCRTLMDSMLVLLFSKGYDLEMLSNYFDISILTPLKTEQYYSIKSQHDKFIQKIVKADQQANIRKAIDPDKWIKTSLRNIKEIIHYQNKIDSLKIPYFTLESSNLYVVFTHFFQMWHNSQLVNKEGFIKRVPWMKGLANVNYASFGVISFLKKQVEKGYFSAQTLGNYISSYVIPFPNYAYYQIDDCFFILDEEFFKPEALNNINQHRKYLALGSNADFIKKARFMDSVRFNGEIFKPIEKDDSRFFNNSIENCSFFLVDGYRKTMYMANPETAKREIARDSVLLTIDNFEHAYDFID